MVLFICAFAFVWYYRQARRDKPPYTGAQLLAGAAVLAVAAVAFVWWINTPV